MQRRYMYKDVDGKRSETVSGGPGTSDGGGRMRRIGQRLLECHERRRFTSEVNSEEPYVRHPAF